MADGGETADEEHATPKRQKTEVEEPESASRNAARMYQIFREAVKSLSFLFWPAP